MSEWVNGKEHGKNPGGRTKRSRAHADKVEILKRNDGEAVYSGENEEVEEQDQKGYGRIYAECPARGVFCPDFGGQQEKTRSHCIALEGKGRKSQEPEQRHFKKFQEA